MTKNPNVATPKRSRIQMRSAIDGLANLVNPHGTIPSTHPMAAVSTESSQNSLVDYLRKFNEEKGKATCQMSKAQFKVFGLISNGKFVNGVPYSDTTQIPSALCSFSRDLGVIYYPTKCKWYFLVDFGQSDFFEEMSIWGGWRCQFSVNSSI
jgi:hypothetical protein